MRKLAIVTSTLTETEASKVHKFIVSQFIGYPLFRELLCEMGKSQKTDSRKVYTSINCLCFTDVRLRETEKGGRS